MKIMLKPTPVNLVLFSILAIGMFVGFPLLLIWSLNTLFPVLVIPYNFWTWLAALVLLAPIVGSKK